MRNLYADYIKLRQIYPEVDLGFKGEQIADVAKRVNKPKYFVKGNKEIFLKLLKDEPMTTRQIALKTNMTKQGAGYIIKELIKECRICLVGYGKRKVRVYGVNDVNRCGGIPQPGKVNVL